MTKEELFTTPLCRVTKVDHYGKETKVVVDRIEHIYCQMRLRFGGTVAEVFSVDCANSCFYVRALLPVNLVGQEGFLDVNQPQPVEMLDFLGITDIKNIRKTLKRLGNPELAPLSAFC